jgi:hypothetical protein
MDCTPEHNWSATQSKNTFTQSFEASWQEAIKMLVLTIPQMAPRSVSWETLGS